MKKKIKKLISLLNWFKNNIPNIEEIHMKDPVLKIYSSEIYIEVSLQDFNSFEVYLYNNNTDLDKIKVFTELDEDFIEFIHKK